VSKTTKKKARGRQLTFSRIARSAHPGRRLGRKPSEDSGVSHARRPSLSKCHPVHINIKWCAGLPSLREPGARRVLSDAFRATNAKGKLRVVHFSIQGNHLHMLCEAEDAQTLSRQMQGLKVRIARRLNAMWGRTGTVFADRYHRVDLKQPSQVRRAIRYVLQNTFRHSSKTPSHDPRYPDPYSSGQWFKGWRESYLDVDEADLKGAPVQQPQTWLMKLGWLKHHAPISINERPANVA
jgi:REP element-mobilizing transposase RayT